MTSVKRRKKKNDNKNPFYFFFEHHIFSFGAAGNASASLEKAIPSGLD